MGKRKSSWRKAAGIGKLGPGRKYTIKYWARVPKSSRPSVPKFTAPKRRKVSSQYVPSEIRQREGRLDKWLKKLFRWVTP